jgi:hypothetical protein
MVSQIRFAGAKDLANKMIAKLDKQELQETTRELILHINAQIPVKQLEQTVAASNSKVAVASPKPKSRKPEVSTDKMWLYRAKKGWALANLNMPIDRVVQRLQQHYDCKILATKDGKINFLPSKPTTIDELQKKGFVVYRQDLNKAAA